MSEAMLYEKQEGDVVTCFLCEHRCRIRPGRRGVCGIRENRRGTLISRVCNRPVSTRPASNMSTWVMSPGEQIPFAMHAVKH